MLLDIHTHIERYKGSYKKTALKEIRKLGILSISNSVDLPSYEDNRELAEKNPLIIPSAGIHPINADYYINKFEEIETAVNSSLFVGEVGLDGKIPGDKTHFDNQKKVFEFILKRAKELDKPVIVHCREAEEETYEMLKRLKLERVVIHWYSGPIETYIKMVRRGFKFSIGFMVLHSDFIRVIARRINREQLLIETDNPAGYEKNHHIPGMPHIIKDIIRETARLRNQSQTEIEQINWENFMHMLTSVERQQIIMAINKSKGL